MDISKFDIKEPSQRKVMILKNDDIVEIFIPSVGLFSRFTMLSLIFLIFPVCLINFFTLSIPKDIRLFPPVVTFNLVISLIAIGVVLLSEFAQKRFSISRQKISWSYEIFGLKLKDLFPASVPGIVRIAKTKPTWNRWFLQIWAGRRLYEISTSDFSPFAVTNSEIDLLAQELSNWLELTILQD
ncbi:serine/threonine kinase [Calothrix sp. NIES-4071]|nr:serine/threonine kinase [Calothrix sp. NIES-4071]BAZ59640.1 serine/threonine kinase [Calothrix sp. NIES-4105]